MNGLDLPASTTKHRLEFAGESLRIVRVAGDLPVGNISVKPAGDAIQIEGVCVDEHERGYGAGTDAVRLLLAAAEGEFSRAVAVAPFDNGLAVYFWTRMGFRPLFGMDAIGLRFERNLT